MSFVFAAVSAVGAAIAAPTFVAIATAVSYVGAAMTVVGTVTKSKELVKVGKVLGIAGGVASLAAGAYAALTSDAIGGAAAGGGGAAGAGAEDVILDTWAGDFGMAEAGAETFGSSAPSWAKSSVAATEGMAAPQASGVLGGSTGQAATKFGEPAVRMFGEEAVKQTAEQSMLGEIGTAIGKVGAIAPPPGTDAGSIAQWWGNQSESTKNTIMQMGGKAIGSLFDGWTQEQKMAFEREKFNLEQQKYNTGVANANAQPTTVKTPVSAGGLLYAKRG